MNHIIGASLQTRTGTNMREYGRGRFVVRNRMGQLDEQKTRLETADGAAAAGAPASLHVVAYDYGIKHNIIALANLTRVSCDRCARTNGRG